VTPALLGILSALGGSFIAYLAVVRRLSGKIKTSDAAQLWEESRSIRQDLEKRNQYLRDQLDKCGQRIDKLEEIIEDLRERLRRNGSLE
jgi:malate synthase